MIAPPSSRLLIVVTLLLSLLAWVYPLSWGFIWLRPDWPLLVLVYWVLMAPQQVGVATGFMLGIMVDILQGSVPGQNALAFVLIAYIASLNYQQVRMGGELQQSGWVLIAALVHVVITLWVQNIEGGAVNNAAWLLGPLVTAICWSPVKYLIKLFDRNLHFV